MFKFIFQNVKLAKAKYKKKMKFFLIVIICCISHNFIYGQNLVPNPSFEKIYPNSKVKPCGYYEFDKIFQKWHAINSTPDGWNLSSRNWGNDTITIQGRGNFIGINYSPSSAEVVQAQLESQIKKGKIYKIEILVGMPLTIPHPLKPVLSTSTFLHKDFGVLFTKQKITLDIHRFFIIGKPQVTFTSSFITSGRWRKVIGYFKADMDYDYAAIGLYHHQKEGRFFLKENLESTYFFLDEISIIEVDSIPEKQEFNDNEIVSQQPLPNLLKIDTFTINDILFQTGSTSLNLSALQELDILIEKIGNSFDRIKIIGHTDNSGSSNMNKKLSKNRAKSVFNYLNEKGMDMAKITFQGHGEAHPISTNTTISGRAKNRRVEVIVVYSLPKRQITSYQKRREPYLFSKDIEKESSKAWEYTYITNYQKAIATQVSNAPQTVWADTISFQKCQPVSAKDYILYRTKSETITLINEAHHYPQNRAFITELLPSFYEQGYRYIGLEALKTPDSLLNKRKYPTLKNGEMVKEPLMGDLIRRAIAIGFTVFNYDVNSLELERKVAESKKKQKINPLDNEMLYLADSDFTLNMNIRDHIQAQNITNFIKKHPKSKILIIAGLGHIRELSSDFWSPMAYELKQLTGINPLTIHQSGMIEKSNSSDESVFYTNFKKKNILTSTVFIEDGQSFVAREYDPFQKTDYVKYYDIQVFHPPTDWSLPRPFWMTMNGYRKPYKLKIGTKVISMPFLVLAFKAGEPIDEAIPMDILEVSDMSKDNFLLLPKGQYIIVFKNNDYKIFHQETIEVK